MRRKLFRLSAKGFALAAVVSMGVWSCQPEESPVVDLSNSALEFIKYQNGDIIPGKYIVTLKSTGLNARKDMSYDAVQASMRKSGSNLLAKYRIADAAIEHVYGSTIEGFSVSLSEEQAQLLAKDPAVSYIEPDRYISIAQRGKPKGGDGGSTGQSIPWGIDRVGGGQTYTGNGIAFIIDSGIEASHPDLNVDVSKGFNAFTSGRDSDLSADGNGHGTHVAGTVAAINNSIGVVGVAAGATVVPVKVLDSRGSGAYSGVIAGVNHVAATGKSGDVANMSLGGPVSQALDDAVLAAAVKGVKFVIAAGNSGANAANYSPARVNGNNIYTISAMDSGGRLASFSNFGDPPVDFAAPGVAVNSTYKGGGYASISGTSMASPHVAGILLWGDVRADGTITGDKDSTPDPIAVR